MIIQEYVDTLINTKRYELICEGLLNFKDELKNSVFGIANEFNKLYKIAKQTKKEEDVKKAIDFFKKNKEMLRSNKFWKMYKELSSIYSNIMDKKQEIEYNKKWKFRNGKKVTIPEIESHLKPIIDKYNKDPKCIKDCDKYCANLICDLLEDGGNECIYEIIDGDQDARCNMLKWSYKIGEQLENELPLSVGYGDGDEGCLYINY